MMLSSRRPAGVTLLEVILAMGLSSLVLVALYQVLILHGKYLELAQVELREPMLARSIFGRLGEELSRITPRSASVGEPQTASQRIRKFLEVGLNQSADAALDPLANDLTQEASDLPPIAERFYLVGNSQRLLIFTTREPAADRVDDAIQFRGDESRRPDQSADQTGEATKLADWTPTSPYSVILYALRPKPKEEPKEGEFVDSASDAVRYEGLIRLEIREPFLEGAWLAAEQQLLDSLPRENEALDTAAPTSTSQELEELPRDAVRVRHFAGEIKALRFRYHDGVDWRDQWERIDQAPLAIDVQIGFEDPSAPQENEAEPLAADGALIAPSEPAPDKMNPSDLRSNLSSADDVLIFGSPYRRVFGLAGASRRLSLPTSTTEDDANAEMSTETGSTTESTP